MIDQRRSVRQHTDEPVPEEVMRKAFAAAVLAPNSSNTQTWNFYWVKTPEKRSRLVRACFGQAAARTAQELVVIVANPKLWRRSQPGLLQYVDSIQAPKPVRLYYEKLIPLMYIWGPFSLFGYLKWLGFTLAGLFRPVPRGPYTRRDQQEKIYRRLNRL